MRLRMPQKDFSTQTAVFFFQLPYSDNLVIEKIYNRPEQNKPNKMACLKNALYVTGIFQYCVSVYAINRRNGYYSIPVCWGQS